MVCLGNCHNRDSIPCCRTSEPSAKPLCYSCTLQIVDLIFWTQSLVCWEEGLGGAEGLWAPSLLLAISSSEKENLCTMDVNSNYFAGAKLSRKCFKMTSVVAVLYFKGIVVTSNSPIPASFLSTFVLLP